MRPPLEFFFFFSIFISLNWDRYIVVVIAQTIVAIVTFIGKPVCAAIDLVELQEEQAKDTYFFLKKKKDFLQKACQRTFARRAAAGRASAYARLVCVDHGYPSPAQSVSDRTQNPSSTYLFYVS